MDKNTHEKAKAKKEARGSWLDSSDKQTGPTDEEKRVLMYRNMRDELLKEESKAKTEG